MHELIHELIVEKRRALALQGPERTRAIRIVEAKINGLSPKHLELLDEIEEEYYWEAPPCQQ